MYVTRFHDKDGNLMFSIESETEPIIDAGQESEFGRVDVLLGNQLINLYVNQKYMGDEHTYQRVQVDTQQYGDK